MSVPRLLTDDELAAVKARDRETDRAPLYVLGPRQAGDVVDWENGAVPLIDAARQHWDVKALLGHIAVLEGAGRNGGERGTLTVPEAARVLGIGRNSAYAAVRRGEIPVIRLGRRTVVSRAALDKLLAGPVIPPSPEDAR